MPKEKSSRSISSVIILVLLISILPVELFIVRFVGAEPYPALFQPSFGAFESSGDKVSFRQGTLTAVTEDGRELNIDPYEILPESTVDPISIWAIRFGPEAHIEQDIWRPFFRSALIQLHPDLNFEKIRIRWYNFSFSTNEENKISRRVLSDVIIALR